MSGRMFQTELFGGNILYLLLRNFWDGDNLLSYKQKAGITPSLSYLILHFQLTTTQQAAVSE